MALIGVSVAIHPGDANHSGTAPGYVACGGAVAAVCVLLMVAQVTARLTVSEYGLTWRALRTRSVAWADIQEVLIVPAGSWYRPAIRSGGSLIRIQGVAGSHRYIERIVAAITDAQLHASELAPAEGTERPRLSRLPCRPASSRTIALGPGRQLTDSHGYRGISRANPSCRVVCLGAGCRNHRMRVTRRAGRPRDGAISLTDIVSDQVLHLARQEGNPVGTAGVWIGGDQSQEGSSQHELGVELARHQMAAQSA